MDWQLVARYSAVKSTEIFTVFSRRNTLFRRQLLKHNSYIRTNAAHLFAVFEGSVWLPSNMGPSYSTSYIWHEITVFE